MSNFRLLEVSEGLNHSGKEHNNIFLLEGLFPATEVSFKVGNALFHLNIPFLRGVSMSPLLFFFSKDIATFILNNARMSILLEFGQKLNFLPENKLRLFVIESDLLDTLNVVLLVINFVNDTIASSNDMSDLKVLVELTIATYELHCFIVHDDYTYNQISAKSHSRNVQIIHLSPQQNTYHHSKAYLSIQIVPRHVFVLLHFYYFTKKAKS